MADALTQRQREILDFISASIVERGFPPTLREIGEHFSIKSTNGVNDHLKALEKKGHLRREDLKSRAMRPTSMLTVAQGGPGPVMGAVIPFERKVPNPNPPSSVFGGLAAVSAAHNGANVSNVTAIPGTL